ncbi:hypothetical protein ACOSP7_026881 [Xanthoceras sorbifolium]
MYSDRSSILLSSSTLVLWPSDVSVSLEFLSDTDIASLDGITCWKEIDCRRLQISKCNSLLIILVNWLSKVSAQTSARWFILCGR